MRNFIVLFLLTALTSFSFSTDLNAQIFAKFEKSDIQGDSNTPGYENLVVFSSFEFGASNPQDPMGRSRGQAQLSEITLTKAFDKASVPLLESAVKGQKFPRVIIQTTRKSSKGLYTNLEITLHEASLVNHQISSDGNRPIENLAIQYQRIEVKHLDANKHAINEFEWDRVQGRQ